MSWPLKNLELMGGGKTPRRQGETAEAGTWCSGYDTTWKSTPVLDVFNGAQRPANTHPGRQQAMAQALGFLAPK